jgi:hypothetical protein
MKARLLPELPEFNTAKNSLNQGDFLKNPGIFKVWPA